MIAMNSLFQYFDTGFRVLASIGSRESTPIASASRRANTSKIQSTRSYDAEIVLEDDASCQSMIDKLVVAKRRP
jgi:hypothetical protein